MHKIILDFNLPDYKILLDENYQTKYLSQGKFRCKSSK